MLNIKSALPLLLVNLLAVTADKSVTVKKQIGFGKRVVTSFNVDSPTTRDWIGIYQTYTGDDLSKLSFLADDLFWAYTNSGTQEETSDDAKTTGTVTFNGINPSEGQFAYWMIDARWLQQWPVNPGKHKVCLNRGLRSVEWSKLLADCVPLKIILAKKKRNQVKNKAWVRGPKTEVKFDEPFQISFNSKLKVPNSQIEIYEFKKFMSNDYMVNRPPLMWVYTGCDNVFGDQVANSTLPLPRDQSGVNDCKKKRKRGTVNFNATNTGLADTEYGYNWPLPVGEYVIRLSYYKNMPRKLYKQAKVNLKVVD